MVDYTYLSFPQISTKMNLLMYKSCCNQNVPQNESVQYLQNWIDYENIAID